MTVFKLSNTNQYITALLHNITLRMYGTVLLARFKNTTFTDIALRLRYVMRFNVSFKMTFVSFISDCYKWLRELPVLRHRWRHTPPQSGVRSGHGGAHLSLKLRPMRVALGSVGAGYSCLAPSLPRTPLAT